MKRIPVYLSFMACLLLLSAYIVADHIITRLGMEHRTAQHYIISNLLGNFRSGEMEEDNGSEESESVYQQAESFQLPYARLLPAVIAGDKAGAAKEVCEYVKQYINSQDFTDEYMKRRDAAKPTSEPWRPDDETIQAMKKSLKEQEAQVTQYKKNKQFPASTLEGIEKSLADQKKQQAIWEDPHPNQTRWEKMYPADPSQVVKQKLQEYLSLVAAVDFNAQLTAPDKYKKKMFVNPAYEKQTLKWKACYRAGKEVNDVITTFVKEWLKGDIITKEKIKMPDFKTPAPEPVRGNAPVAVPPAGNKVDSVAKPVKEKKNLLNKLKKATGF